MSAQHRCTVCGECTTVMELCLATPIDLLGGMGQMKAYFCPFGDSVNLDVRLVHGLRRTCNWHINCFEHTR
jgi:hypothetical protein